MHPDRSTQAAHQGTIATCLSNVMRAHPLSTFLACSTVLQHMLYKRDARVSAEHGCTPRLARLARNHATSHSEWACMAAR